MSNDTHDTAAANDTNSNNSSTNQDVSFEEQLQVEQEKRLRIMADFENYKKRIEQEKAMFGAMANMGILQEILEIHDDLQLAVHDDQLTLEQAKQSITTAQDKIKATAKQAGVEAIEIQPGDEFDKEVMEAIQAIPDESNKNKVIAVISSAYKYSDKEGVIKAAKVIVGK